MYIQIRNECSVLVYMGWETGLVTRGAGYGTGSGYEGIVPGPAADPDSSNSGTDRLRVRLRIRIHGTVYTTE